MSQNTRPLFITHGHCPDGSCAAWLAWLAFEGEVDIVPLSHGGPFDLTEAAGRDVIMADFCLKDVESMLALAETANSLVVLDHHEGARPILEALPSDVLVVFDNERSGATITRDYLWDRLKYASRIPNLASAIADLCQARDLFTFTDGDDAHNFYAAITSIPSTPESWNAYITGLGLIKILDEGAVINRYRRGLIESAATSAFPVYLGRGDYAFVANVPYNFGSDVAKLINDLGHPIAGYWFDQLDGDGVGRRKWGLRSSKDGGPDVAAIARRYGGNGHVHAAGFRTDTTFFGLLPDSFTAVAS